MLAGTLAYTDVNVERLAPAGTGRAEIDGEEWVFEPSVRFTANAGRLSGLAGVYFFDASQDEFLDLFGGGSFDDSTKTAAAFGEFTYEISEKFDVTLGARYEEETRRREGAVAFFTIDLDETYDVFLPKLVMSWHPPISLRSAPWWVAATRRWGGLHLLPTVHVIHVEPEYVWNYEIFLRQVLAGGAISLTANAFFSDYEDIQLPFNLSPLSVVIRNADKAETRGLELSLRAKLTSRLGSRSSVWACSIPR